MLVGEKTGGVRNEWLYTWDGNFICETADLPGGWEYVGPEDWITAIHNAVDRGAASLSNIPLEMVDSLVAFQRALERWYDGGLILHDDKYRLEDEHMISDHYRG